MTETTALYAGDPMALDGINRTMLLGAGRTEAKLSLESVLVDAFYLSKYRDVPVMVWRHLESKEYFGVTLWFDLHPRFEITMAKAVTLALSQVHAEFICVVNASIIVT